MCACLPVLAHLTRPHGGHDGLRVVEGPLPLTVVLVPRLEVGVLVARPGGHGCRRSPQHHRTHDAHGRPWGHGRQGQRRLLLLLLVRPSVGLRRGAVGVRLPLLRLGRGLLRPALGGAGEPAAPPPPPPPARPVLLAGAALARAVLALAPRAPLERGGGRSQQVVPDDDGRLCVCM